jgi:hypothetical protein
MYSPKEDASDPESGETGLSDACCGGGERYVGAIASGGADGA